MEEQEIPAKLWQSMTIDEFKRVASLLQNGIITDDEAREMLGLPEKEKADG